MEPLTTAVPRGQSSWLLLLPSGDGAAGSSFYPWGWKYALLDCIGRFGNTLWDLNHLDLKLHLLGAIGAHSRLGSEGAPCLEASLALFCLLSELTWRRAALAMSRNWLLAALATLVRYLIG